MEKLNNPTHPHPLFPLYYENIKNRINELTRCFLMSGCKRGKIHQRQTELYTDSKYQNKQYRKMYRVTVRGRDKL